MGEHAPDFAQDRYKVFLKSIERLTAMLHAGKEGMDVLERETDQLVYELHNVGPQEFHPAK